MGILNRLFKKSEKNREKNTPSKSKVAEEHFTLGAELAKQEKWAEAIVSLKEAVRLNPDHAKAHMSLAQRLFQSKRLGLRFWLILRLPEKSV